MFKVGDVVDWVATNRKSGEISMIDKVTNTAIVWFNQNDALPYRVAIDELSSAEIDAPKVITIGSKVSYIIESYNGCGLVLELIHGNQEMVKVALGIWAGAYVVLPLSEVMLCE